MTGFGRVFLERKYDRAPCPSRDLLPVIHDPLPLPRQPVTIRVETSSCRRVVTETTSACRV
jgi:hypothetical protein